MTSTIVAPDAGLFPRLDSTPESAWTRHLRHDLRPSGPFEEFLTDRIARAAERPDDRSVSRALADLARYRALKAASDSTEEGAVPLWRERLVFDPTVSDSSPVVRGTWITAEHVASLVVEGWTWAEILRIHPELNEDDVRACLAFAVEEE